MKRIFLVGFRGAGKSTIGAALAKHFGWEFVDLDARWEAAAGRTINEFVAERGIAAFRAEEARLLRELGEWPRDEGQVVATGGGILEGQESRDWLAASSAPKIYLEVTAEEAWARLAESPDRRKIGDLRTHADVARLLAERRPAYEKIATFRVPTRDISGTLGRVVEIVEGLEKSGS